MKAKLYAYSLFVIVIPLERKTHWLLRSAVLEKTAGGMQEPVFIVMFGWLLPTEEKL